MVKLDYSAITTAIASLGFPIFVALYMMWQNDKLRSVIEENTIAIVELRNIVTELKNEIE